MRKIKTLFIYLLISFLRAVPYFGFVFLAVMLVAGGIALYNMEFNSVLHVGLIVYLACAVVTLFFAATHSFLNCCVCLSKLRHHLAHHWDAHFKVIMTAIFWPYRWYSVDRDLSEWESSYLDLVSDSLEYWFVSRWNGTAYIITNFKTGESISDRSKA